MTRRAVVVVLVVVVVAVAPVLVLQMIAAAGGVANILQPISLAVAVLKFRAPRTLTRVLECGIWRKGRFFRICPPPPMF